MKLEIGPGKRRLGEDWVGVDVKDGPAVDVLCVWGEEQLPFPDNSCSVIYASHVIEHVWWYNVPFALSEAHRCLVPGGKIEIWTVDFARIVEGYLAGYCGDSWRKFNPSGDYMTWVNGRIFTYGPEPHNIHKSCFDKEYLSNLLFNANFKSAYELKTPRGEDHGAINLGVGGEK